MRLWLHKELRAASQNKSSTSAELQLLLMIARERLGRKPGHSLVMLSNVYTNIRNGCYSFRVYDIIICSHWIFFFASSDRW